MKNLTYILLGLILTACGKSTVNSVNTNYPYRDVATAAIKAYYYQRSGVAIEEQYAGVYARPAGHLDTHVQVHPSAATDSRPAGTVISSPYGWYDAGDYGKYIVNSAYTVGMMMMAYQWQPEYYQSLNVNIPESGSQVPDLLEEVMFNLKWMQTMQDEDGGVYHKLTTPTFESFIKPTECQQTRYVVMKATPATLDFAATMAMAARVYAPFPEYSNFCATALKQARRAWDWAIAHPDTYYDQAGMAKQFEPEIKTGAYGDNNCSDEFFWAATELWLATGEQPFEEAMRQHEPSHFTLPTWPNVAGLAMYERIDEYKDLFLDYIQSCPLEYGHGLKDFYWGCNGEACAGKGAAMLLAYRLTGEEKYLHSAEQTADWLMGNNPTGYCFITGFGEKPVMHPHHRLSASDDVEAPIPGWLAGGPNPLKQDGCNYFNVERAKCYADIEEAYACNEIAINWNATLIPLMAGLDKIHSTPAQALIHRLRFLSRRGIMFGHQDDPFYGTTWQWEKGRSDTYELVGDYPGVMGFDLGGLEEKHDKNLDSVPFEWMREEAINHVKNGGVITFSWHPRNPRTGSNAWDVSDPTTVQNILPGGEQHELFVEWMNDVATFLETLVDDKGEPIPFILRPWHEYNGSWFWWGRKNCTNEQWIALWNMFQDYMNERMPTNIVWCCSPNLDGNFTTEYLESRFPEAGRVDILGYDTYQWGTEKDFVTQSKADIAFLYAYAQEHGMLFTISECGIQNSPVADWWTRVFLPLTEGKEVCYFLPWRNWHREHFGAAKGLKTEKDFIKLYNNPRTLFLRDL